MFVTTAKIIYKFWLRVHVWRQIIDMCEKSRRKVLDFDGLKWLLKPPDWASATMWIGWI